MHGVFNRISFFFRRHLTLLIPVIALLMPMAAAWGDGSGTIQYTKRFDGVSLVKEVEWTYDRSVPSLTFTEPRTIWTGAGAPEGLAGSDGLFHTPEEELIVANHQASSIWKFDPTKTDEVLVKVHATTVNRTDCVRHTNKG